MIGYWVYAGLGFALAGIPTDFADAEAGLSRLHFASICLGLAGWCFALARISHANSGSKFVRTTGTYAALCSVLPLLGLGAGASPAPIAQKLNGLCYSFQ